MVDKKMTASQIVSVLAAKHLDDVFVPECNLGSAWARCGRMDAWAMKKSWSDPVTWGYEVKVSRSDFLNDDKWRQYMDHCHEFYWVCPWGLIQPNEVGEGAGLMWVTRTGTRAIRKVKAVRRDIGFSELVFRYVLMSRAQIVRDMHESNRMTEREYWENWLERREVDRAFGERLGRTIREVVEKEVLAVRAENERLKKKHSDYDDIRNVLEELGIDPERPPMTWGLRRRVREAREAVPPALMNSLRSIRSEAKRLEQRLEELSGEVD